MRTLVKQSAPLILATLLALLLALATPPLQATEIKNTDLAVDALRQAEALIEQQQGKQALATLNEILKQYPQHSAALYTKAKLLAAALRLDEAQEIVDVLLQEDPPAALVLHLQGYIYSRQNQWPKALTYYQQAYPHGHDPYLMNTMTQAYLRVQGPDAAIDFLSAHLLQYPAEHNVRLSRAKLYQRQSRFSAALEDYELVKAAQPENPVVWKNMADLFITQRNQRAIPYAREAVRLAPTVAEVMNTLGRALLEFGEPAEALQVLAKAHQAKPRDASIAYDYALALATNQQQEKAGALMAELANSDSPVGTRAKRFLEDQKQ